MGGDAYGFEVFVEPFGHFDDVCAVGCVSADSVFIYVVSVTAEEGERERVSVRGNGYGLCEPFNEGIGVGVDEGEEFGWGWHVGCWLVVGDSWGEDDDYYI